LPHPKTKIRKWENHEIEEKINHKESHTVLGDDVRASEVLQATLGNNAG
jgi:hypothetical protein